MDHRQPHPDLYGLPFSTDEFHGMPYQYLGRSGLRASKAGLGTWKMGYPETGDGSRTDQTTSLKILDRAWELGVTFWDTANRYNQSSGNSERVIGTWFQNNPDKRRDVVLATKVYGLMDGITPNHGGLGRNNIIESVHACLARLCTDYLDLLYFHWCDDQVPPEESLATVEDLVTQGKVRYLGVSNFAVQNLETYRAIEVSTSVRCRVVAVQNQFDIINGENAAQDGVLAYAARKGLAFVAFSPLARGLLTERYLDPAKAGKGDRLYDEKTLDRDARPEVMTKLNRLAALAGEWGLPLSQLVLAYMQTLPGMGPTIVTASTVEQLESNAAAAKIILTEEQTARVREVV